MRALLRLLALLVGFVALPILVVLVGSRLGFTALECVLSALISFPLSTSITLIVGASSTKARRVVAEVQAS